jgi:hypothetical protein
MKRGNKPFLLPNSWVRKAVVLTTGVLALLVIGLFASRWPELVLIWKVSRIERARSWAEAVPLLRQLAREAQDRRDLGILIRPLGASHPNYTCWLFSTIDERFHDYLSPHVPPIFIALKERMDTDETLLALWAHYLRWREDPSVETYLLEVEDPTTGGPRVAGAYIEGSAGCMSVKGYEDHVRDGLAIVGLKMQGVAWFLGMPSFSWSPADIQPPRCRMGRIAKTPVDRLSGIDLKPIEAWLSEHGPFLRYDPDRDRLVSRKGEMQVEDTVGGVPIPPAPTPFPRWSGPLPEIPAVDPRFLHCIHWKMRKTDDH